jgi:hypothetical protein
LSEAPEIKLHPNNVNRDEGIKLSNACNPRTRILKHINAYRSDKTQEDKHREEYAERKKKIKYVTNRNTRLNNIVTG